MHYTHNVTGEYTAVQKQGEEPIVRSCQHHAYDSLQPHLQTGEGAG